MLAARGARSAVPQGAGHGQRQAAAHQQLAVHLRVRVLEKPQPEVHAAGEQRLRHLVLVDGAHLHPHLRVFLCMAVQQRGQKFVGDGGNGRQPHIAQLGGRQVARRALQRVQLAVDAAGFHGQHLRLGRGREACWRAVEQPVAQLQLGVGHSLAHGGWRDAQQAARRAHAAGLQNGLEHFELAQVHGNPGEKGV